MSDNAILLLVIVAAAAFFGYYVIPALRSQRRIKILNDIERDQINENLRQLQKKHNMLCLRKDYGVASAS
jgi:hypothetical protein